MLTIFSPKGRKVGFCVPRLWKEQAQMEEQKEGYQQGGPWTPPFPNCLENRQLPWSKHAGGDSGQRMLGNNPGEGFSPASWGWPQPPSLALTSEEGRTFCCTKGGEPWGGKVESGDRGGSRGSEVATGNTLGQ